MAIILPIILTPAVITSIVSIIKIIIKHHQLREDAKLLLDNGVKHALVTEDQILF